MKSRLFALAAVAALVGCRDVKPPSDLAGPPDPSKIILDGAHGGNKDFWFLPPMVPLPRNNPDFELGKFNNTLRPRLKIDICELNGDNLKGGGLPTELTTCGAIKKTFAPGSVQLVNLPVRQNGWWTLFNLPPDGFYYALWDTRQSNLKVDKYYRIKVFIDGNSTPLGVADVDPMANLFQWKYSLTGEVIQLVDDVMLPITFRVEKGGGSTLCGDATVCASATVTNNSPDGSQTVTVDGGAGAIAGARFPNGWLPANGPQSVVVTVAQVDLGATNPVTGTQAKPCHAGLPLQQFAGCFRFTTTPALAPIDESGRQFATPVTVAVCYVLQGTGDPREKFAEMYSSGPGEPPRALEDASDVGILSPATRNCSNNIIGSNNSKGVTEFASAGWRKVKGGFGALFGVKTAYGVDLGLGGIAKRFSNIGPALTTTLQPVSATEFVLPGGGAVQRFVRLVGSNHHDGEHQQSVGLPNLTVEFKVAPGNGTLGQVGSEVGGSTALSVTTNNLPLDVESPVSGGGYAAVNWQVPTTPGTYRLVATGPALDSSVTFTATVLTVLGVPGFDQSVPKSINNAGQIVVYGIGDASAQAFLWVNGVSSAFEGVSVDVNYALPINADGEIAGTRSDAGPERSAFKWKNGTITNLGTLPGMPRSYSSGINSLGQAVGWTEADEGPRNRAWIWKDGVMSELANSPYGGNPLPVGISDAGVVVGGSYGENVPNGWVAWTWQNGSYSVSSQLASISAISPSGVIVGAIGGIFQTGRAARLENGVVTDLGFLPGDSGSDAVAISSNGRIAGNSSNGSETHAFVWQQGRMTRLPGLGGCCTEARGINASGQIVGSATAPDGKLHAVLWQAPPM